MRRDQIVAAKPDQWSPIWASVQIVRQDRHSEVWLQARPLPAPARVRVGHGLGEDESWELLAKRWSVIVQGTAEVLSTSAEVDEADRAGLRPWVATLKLRYVRIHASTIIGRRLRFGPEPDRDITAA